VPQLLPLTVPGELYCHSIILSLSKDSSDSYRYSLLPQCHRSTADHYEGAHLEIKKASGTVITGHLNVTRSKGIRGD